VHSHCAALTDRGFGVSEVRVEAEAVQRLVDKLQAVDLTDEERQLLDALLAIAGDVILRAGPVPIAARVEDGGEQDAPYAIVDTQALGPLRDQLVRAFTPGLVPNQPVRPLVTVFQLAIGSIGPDRLTGDQPDSDQPDSDQPDSDQPDSDQPDPGASPVPGSE
jgi:hypothetical protein